MDGGIMSTVKSKKLQVGTDATATNNFTIYQPATPDGTLRIGVGNADSPTEVAQFNSTGIVGDGSQLTGLPEGGGNYSIQVFTSSGTYTRPAGLVKAKITVVGGGGNGGSSNGRGGGGGGTAVLVVDSATLGASQTVTIGAGGGGTSSFGTLASATGGSNGGSNNTSTIGVGGIGSNGTINFRGGSSVNANPSPGGTSFFGEFTYGAGGLICEFGYSGYCWHNLC